MLENRGNLDKEDIKSYLDICVCTHVRKASRVITRLYDDMLNGTGIRSTQLIILMVLKDLDESTVSDLADELFMDASTVARNLRPLQKMNLISMIPGRDRRKKMVSLTELGHETVAESLTNWRKAQDRFFSVMSDDELKKHLNSVENLTSVVTEEKLMKLVG